MMITTAALHRLEMEVEFAGFLDAMSKYAALDKDAQLARLLGKLWQRAGYRLATRGTGSVLGRMGGRMLRLPGTAVDAAGATRTLFNPATRAVTTPIRAATPPALGSIVVPNRTFQGVFTKGPIEQALIAQRRAQGGVAGHFGQVMPASPTASTVFAPTSSIIPPVPRAAPPALRFSVTPGMSPAQIRAVTPPPMSGDVTGVGIPMPAL